MSALRRTYKYFSNHRGQLAISIFFNLMYAVFNAIALLSMIPVLNILFKAPSAEIPKQIPKYDGNLLSLGDFIEDYASYHIQQIKLTDGPEQLLLYSCVIFLTCFLLRNVFSYFSEYFLFDLRINISNKIRRQIHDKILELPVAYFNENKKGDIITKMTSDVGNIEGNILNSVITMLRSPIFIIFQIIVLFSMETKLTLFILIVFPIMGFLISYIGKSLKKNSAKAQNELGKLFSFMDESLTGNKIIKIFNAETVIKNRFDQTLETLKKYSFKVMKRNALASPVSEFLGGITITLIVYFGGLLVLGDSGIDSGGAFVAYISMFYTMFDPIKRFARSISNLQNGEVSAKRVYDLLDTEITVPEPENPVEKNSFDQKIEFKNLSFSYAEDSQQVLKDFNLTIEKGQSVALVGQSGSGKTTIANLLARFYDPSQGEILIDGVNIKDMRLKDYRHLLGLVSQESILFNETIGNNIKLGKTDATQEEIEQAAKVANAVEFIEKFPEEYETNIGDAGGKLSGGQKQRINIARAVLKNPPIMIMDEATSALDTKSEHLVQTALENMMQNRTSLVIAHRLSTIQKADLIVVMDHGRIIEQGTHQELMNRKGTYAHLIEMQKIGD